MKRFLTATLLASTLGFSTPSAAQQPYNALSLSAEITQHHYAPAYQKLADHSRQQADLWAKTSCTTLPLTLSDAHKDAYDQTRNAWAYISATRFGPVTSFLRYDRLYHWPERRNAIARSLKKIRQTQDENMLDAAILGTASVALQGFPALERLTHKGQIISAYDCKLAQAITQNIATISQETAKDWHELTDTLKQAGINPLYFESHDEWMLRIFTDFLTGFQLITDQKLALPMGASLAKANGKRAESWRSDFSTRALQQAADSLSALGRFFQPYLAPKSAALLETTLRNFSNAAHTLPPALNTAVHDAAQRKQLNAFAQLTHRTRDTARDLIQQGLGLSVGFNSLDGD